MSKPKNKSKLSESSLEEMGNSMVLESLFSTYVLLDVFLSNEFINKIRSFFTQLTNRHDQENLIQGYKIILIIRLDNYIDEIVRSPEMIGVTADLDYRDYWAFTKGRGREIARGAPRTDHLISKFVAKANLFIDSILALKTCDDIQAFADKTRDFRECLRLISEKGYSASKDDKPVSMGDAMRVSSSVLLWSSSCDPLPIAHKYTDYFIGRNRGEPDIHSLDEIVEECHLPSGLTRFDMTNVNPDFFPRPLPEKWALGYVFSLHEGIKSLASEEALTRLKSLDNFVLNVKNWHDLEKYDLNLDKVYGLPSIYRGFKYGKHQVITDTDRIPLVAEAMERPSPEKLLSIFGNRARIVERGYPGAVGSFECLLDGALQRSRRTKEPAKVAIIVHKLGRGEEDYSVAIFMPAYGGGFIPTNGSMWWVFYWIGNNHSGSTSHRWKFVLDKINRSKKRIELMIVEANKQEFYRYCEDPGYSRICDAIVLTNKITSDVRGTYPELLLANMLTNLGYNTVLNRIRPKLLESTKGEFDTVGILIKDNSLEKITIFESKGQANTDIELQKEIDRFSANVEVIRKNLSAFCDEFNIPFSPSVDIEAIFVSMDHLERKDGLKNFGPYFSNGVNLNVPKNVTLWDFDELYSRLKKSKVHSDYLALLRKIPVAVVIDPIGDRGPELETL